MKRLLVFVFALALLGSCDFLSSEKIEYNCYTEDDISKIKSIYKDSLNLLKTSLQSFKFVYTIGDRELKVGDKMNRNDPDNYGWKAIDGSPHYILYETPDEWLIQIGNKGDRWLKIETLNPKIIWLDEDLDYLGNHGAFIN